MKKLNKVKNKQVVVKYHCISCDCSYITNEVISSEDRLTKEINICRNCSPVYTGAAASTIRVGSVEKFYARSKKVKPKS